MLRRSGGSGGAGDAMRRIVVRPSDFIMYDAHGKRTGNKYCRRRPRYDGTRYHMHV